MAKQVFLSFNYKDDNWRVQTIKNIGSIESEPLLSSNDWEKVKEDGDDAIKKWINKEMAGKDCLIVLIGSNTSNRKWVKYEIKHAWDEGIAVLGVYIHKLKDSSGNQTTKGSNPFTTFNVNGTDMDDIVYSYDPPFETSPYVYDYIKDNITAWIDKAIKVRGEYS